MCFVGSLFASCNTYDAYSIDSPEGLQDKIDSIAKANNPQRGDTLKLDILTAIVGPEDNSAGWWSSFSDYFTVPANRLLHLEFENYGTGVSNWNNWNLCLANGERDTESYAEYFVLRSDMYGWGNLDYNGAMIGSDYAEKLEGDDMWATFREKMQGAMVYMDIDHSKTGNAFVTVKHVAKDGTTFTETYQQPVSSTADINAFLICDGSHFVMKNAYTITSKVQAVDDQNAVSIEVTGHPEVLEVGQTDYWGDAIATVTFADGSTAVADTADITLTCSPSIETPGVKTVIYSYSKTKQGNFGPSVAGYYTVEVTNAISSLEVTKLPYLTTYYYADGKIAPATFTEGMEITATYSDGSTGILPLSNVTVAAPTAKAGTQNITVTYAGSTRTVTTSFPVQVKAGICAVGATDYLNGWWTTFLEPDEPVAAGHSVTFKMQVLSDNLGNYHSPCTILRGAALNEYAVVRMDNFGWGGGYDGNPNLLLESNWNWDTFMSNIHGSDVAITVTNNGNGTANVHYDVTYQNGEKHFQDYKGIKVNSDDLQMSFVTEESCLIIYE